MIAHSPGSCVTATLQDDRQYGAQLLSPLIIYIAIFSFLACAGGHASAPPASLHRRGKSWGSGPVDPLSRGVCTSVPVPWTPRLTAEQAEWLTALLSQVRHLTAL